MKNYNKLIQKCMNQQKAELSPTGGRLFQMAPIVAATLLSLSAVTAQATIINFSGLTGTGSLFNGAGNAQTLTLTAGLYDVVFSGGTLLGPNISNLPVSSDLAYGTADFANSGSQTGYTNPISIQFFDTGTTNLASNLSNFFLTLYNGEPATRSYSLSNNDGSATFNNVASNANSGQHTFVFPTASVLGNPLASSFTIGDTNSSSWDFLIGSIGFNEDILPGQSDSGTFCANGQKSSQTCSPFLATALEAPVITEIPAVPEPEINSMMMIGLGLLWLVKLSGGSQQSKNRLLVRIKT